MRIPKLKYNDTVEVIWLDTLSCSSWRDQEKVKNDKAAVCLSLGYYVTHDEKVIIISPDINNMGDRSSTTIPLGVVQKIRKLK